MNKMLKGVPITLTLIAIIMLFLGCTQGKAQTKGNDYVESFKNEEFDVFDYDDEIPAMKKGNTQVKFDQDNYYQKGLASWYGREFHGKTTASGEKFNMNELTAAHKTLPFGTIVEVTNFDNGKTIQLKINDRGPYRGNRIIDLSFASAQEIDMVKAGEANVGIKVLKLGNNNITTSNSNPDKQYVEPVSDTYIFRNTKTEYQSDDNGGLKVQAGAFYSKRNAENLKTRIETMTDNPVKIVQEGGFYKVRIEGLQNAKEVQRLRNILSEENISSFSVE